MKRIYIYLGAIALIFLAVSCSRQTVTGNGDQQYKVVPVHGFNSLIVTGNFHVTLTHSSIPTLKIKADSNLFRYIIVKQIKNTIVVYPIDNYNLEQDQPIEISATTALINQINVSGATHFEGSGISTDKLSIKGTGASNITLAGKTNELIMHISGATKVDSRNLRSNEAFISATGASHVFVHADKSLALRLSGASNLLYSGDAKITDEQVYGASHVSRAAQ